MCVTDRYEYFMNAPAGGCRSPRRSPPPVIRFWASLPRPHRMACDGARAHHEESTYAEQRGALGAVHAVDSGKAGVDTREDLAAAAGDRLGRAARLAVCIAQPRGVRRSVRVGGQGAARARRPGIDL